MESDQCDHVVFNHPLIRQLENGVLRTWVCSAMGSVAVRNVVVLKNGSLYTIAKGFSAYNI